MEWCFALKFRLRGASPGRSVSALPVRTIIARSPMPRVESRGPDARRAEGDGPMVARARQEMRARMSHGVEEASQQQPGRGGEEGQGGVGGVAVRGGDLAVRTSERALLGLLLRDATGDAVVTLA